MKNFFVLLALIVLPYLMKAQSVTQSKHSIHLSTDLLRIKGEAGSQSPSVRYGVNYTTRLGQSRWQLESGLTFTHRSRQLEIYPYGYTYTGVRSRLITADVNVMYSLLKSSRHTWRIGAGPSFWYISNIIDNVSTIWLTQQGELEHVDFKRSEQGKPALGLTLRTAYEYAITPAISIGMQAGVNGTLVSFSPSVADEFYGSLQTIGLQVGYHF